MQSRLSLELLGHIPDRLELNVIDAGAVHFVISVLEILVLLDGLQLVAFFH
jgi:hypothetical protein